MAACAKANFYVPRRRWAKNSRDSVKYAFVAKTLGGIQPNYLGPRRAPEVFGRVDEDGKQSLKPPATSFGNRRVHLLVCSPGEHLPLFLASTRNSPGLFGEPGGAMKLIIVVGPHTPSVAFDTP